jgi:hypothetical protein
MKYQIDCKSLISVEVLNYDAKVKCTFFNPFGENFTKMVDVDITDIGKWVNGLSIQDAMPNLTADEREWFISGIQDWDSMFGDDDE